MSTTAVSSDSTSPPPKQTVSKIFHAETGGDVVFESSDGVLFYVHSRNLAFMSDMLPAAYYTRATPPKDPMPLPENSSTLELLFQFTYHRMPPDLKKLDFRSLMELAEAAEKYVIHYARAMCVKELSKFIRKESLKIVAFACKHNHEGLFYELAPILVRRPLSELAYVLPPSFYVSWTLYHDQFRQPLSKEIATEHFRRNVTDLKIPVSCGNGCAASDQAKRTLHDEKWLEKINQCQERILKDGEPRSSIESLLESKLPVAPDYRSMCCFKYMEWQKRLKEYARKSPGDRTLQDLVEEYKERMGTGKK
ncbi:hypothetical protein D9758_010338 [Tetrapyrgos nigripes]|uniref:BTB domain-containing protein n=1 Tax=Tetrapyrgos nigripes TaxID=182062 RepID=A0A8H5CZD1_9AGAR|nr:hypothetical protein D9758_010338 [Tetrapyrgos nigripes]